MTERIDIMTAEEVEKLTLKYLGKNVEDWIIKEIKSYTDVEGVVWRVTARVGSEHSTDYKFQTDLHLVVPDLKYGWWN